MPPPNTTAATAIVVTTLPYTNVQEMHDAGVTYHGWYRYDADFNGVVGVWGAGAGTYKAGYFVESPAAGTSYMGISALPNNVTTYPNQPFYIPVEPGKSYWIDFAPSSGNPTPAQLTVSILKAPHDAIQTGDFISNREVDEEYEFPLTVSSSTTSFETRRFMNLGALVPGTRTVIGLPHGPNGVVTSEGHVIFADDQFSLIKIYNRDLTELVAITRYQALNDVHGLGNGAARDTFFVLHGPTATLDECHQGTGDVIQSWTVPPIATMGFRFAVNTARTRLYSAVSGPNTTIKVWDLVNAVALPNLDVVINHEAGDVLVMPDGTIVSVFLGPSGPPKAVIAKRYSAAGAILNTYTFGGVEWRQSLNPPRLGYALEPESFWVTLKPQAAFHLSYYRRIQMSDGAVLADITHANYLACQYINQQTPTDPPVSRFGPEKASALLVMPAPTGTGSILVHKVTVPEDAVPYEFTATGLTPDSFMLAHGQMQAFTGLAPGDDYAITETPVDDVTVAISVSNGSPATAITVGVGETVTVTFTNYVAFNPDGPFYPNDGDATDRLIRRVRRAPTLNNEQKMHRYSSLALDMEVGISPIEGQGIDAVVNLRWSDNGGATWSNLYQTNTGRLGAYTTRVEWMRLGAARNRVFEVSMSDPIAWVVLGAYLNVTKGTGN